MELFSGIGEEKVGLPFMVISARKQTADVANGVHAAMCGNPAVFKPTGPVEVSKTRGFPPFARAEFSFADYRSAKFDGWSQP